MNRMTKKYRSSWHVGWQSAVPVEKTTKFITENTMSRIMCKVASNLGFQCEVNARCEQVRTRWRKPSAKLLCPARQPMHGFNVSGMTLNTVGLTPPQVLWRHNRSMSGHELRSRDRKLDVAGYWFRWTGGRPSLPNWRIAWVLTLSAFRHPPYCWTDWDIVIIDVPPDRQVAWFYSK